MEAKKAGGKGLDLTKHLQMQTAEKMMADMEAAPLSQTPVKGLVECEYLGHCGFKIQFIDSKNNQRVIYLDFWNDA